MIQTIVTAAILYIVTALDLLGFCCKLENYII